MSRKILVINLGSTSTKLGLYNDLKEIDKVSFSHKTEDLEKFKTIMDQYDYRKTYILDYMNEKNLSFTNLSCIVSRGGIWKPLPSGVLEVTSEMIRDIESEKWGSHSSGLGCKIAYDLGREYGVKVVSGNSPTTDEYQDLARFSGLKEIERYSISHALNHKAMGEKFAKDRGLAYEDLNLIIAHLGGGISILAHKKGKMVDGNSALGGEGPFSPERSGGLASRDVVKMCFDLELTRDEIEHKISGKGGLMSYLGTNDSLKVLRMIEGGDFYARKVFSALAYGIGKEIGSMASVLSGRVDGIILTGGLSKSDLLVDLVKEMVEWIGPVYLYPGEDELLALSQMAVSYLDGGASLNYEEY